MRLKITTDERKLEYNNYLTSKEWGIKRKQVFKIKGAVCERCSCNKKLHVHHKTYERFKDENIDTDLAILCENCHYEYHRQYFTTTIATTDAFIGSYLIVKKREKRKKKLKKNKTKFYGTNIKTRNRKLKLSRMAINMDYHDEELLIL